MSSAAVVIGALRVKTKQWYFYSDMMQINFKREEKNDPVEVKTRNRNENDKETGDSRERERKRERERERDIRGQHA